MSSIAKVVGGGEAVPKVYQRTTGPCHTGQLPVDIGHTEWAQSDQQELVAVKLLLLW